MGERGEMMIEDKSIQRGMQTMASLTGITGNDVLGRSSISKRLVTFPTTVLIMSMGHGSAVYPSLHRAEIASWMKPTSPRAKGMPCLLPAYPRAQW